jgi:hypothetical protein
MRVGFDRPQWPLVLLKVMKLLRIEACQRRPNSRPGAAQ